MNNLRGKDLCHPQGFMRHRKAPTNSVTHPGLMELKNGVVWVGCPDPGCRTEVAIKKCQEHEYHVQNVFNKEFPNLVPKVYEGVRCTGGEFYMYSEFAAKGSLKKNKSSPRVDEYVYKTLLALKKIHDKHPNFRHNDLHIDNVLIRSDGTPLIYDFELANWYGNPVFDEIYKKDYGIFTGNHPMYDFHFFINSVSADLPKRFRDRALTVFPPEYLTGNSPVVKNFRMRSDVKHPNLPTMDQVIRAFSVSNGKMIVLIGSPVKKKVTLPNNSPPPLAKKKKAPGLLTFTNATTTTKKTTKVTPPRPTKKTGVVKFTRANKERVAMMKAQFIRNGMNNVQAELQAIRNIEVLKRAGLLTPSPSPRKSPVVVLRKSPAKRGGGGGKAGPSRRPIPVIVFTETPRRRPRIDSKLCTSYKKDELLNVMRRLGHRVTNDMTLRELCAKLKAPVVSKKAYIRPTNAVIVNVRKVTYPRYLRKNLFNLGKKVGAGVYYKNKKADIVAKLYSKLNKNVKSVLEVSNKSTVTARQVAEKLAKNHGWKNDRHVERLRLLKIYKNNM